MLGGTDDAADPGLNDGAAEIEAMCRWILDRLGPDVPLHFTAFHPDHRMRDVPRTPLATLVSARDRARAAGLRHVYVGNVHDPAAEASHCAGCGRQVIGRDRYVLTDWQLSDRGACLGCGAPFPGLIDGPPGRWGRQRRPVRILAA